MKVIKLSDDDHTLLAAAYAACEDTQLALHYAHKNNKQAQATYNKVLNQLKRKYELVGSASDDQQYLYGHYDKPAEEPAPEPAVELL